MPTFSACRERTRQNCERVHQDKQPHSLRQAAPLFKTSSPTLQDKQRHSLDKQRHSLRQVNNYLHFPSNQLLYFSLNHNLLYDISALRLCL